MTQRCAAGKSGVQVDDRSAMSAGDRAAVADLLEERLEPVVVAAVYQRYVGDDAL